HKRNLGSIANVTSDRMSGGAKRLLSRIERCTVSAADEYAASCGHETMRDRTADPPAAAGDDCCCTLELGHGSVPVRVLGANEREEFLPGLDLVAKDAEH